MTVSAYRCVAAHCGGSITFDTEGPDGRPTQHTVYERGKGPITAAYKVHDCPVRLGIWPPDIDAHPLAEKVS
jgi:hypothetical protein